jgi:chromosome segregation ATPase
MTNQNNILTEEEIRELIGNLNRNPSEAEIRAVADYFWLRPYALQHLEDKKFRESFVRLIYLHKNALDSYIKVDKEVKSLQFLTTSLEQERNELLEKNKQLEVKNKELETKLEESKEEVQMEREEAEKALKTASIWRVRQVDEMKDRHDKERRNLWQQVKKLENILTIKNSQIKNLKESKNWGQYKFKQMFSGLNRTKNRTQEKFQAFIVQKDK